MSWQNGSSIGGDDQGFLKDGGNTSQMAPMSPLNLPSQVQEVDTNLWFFFYSATQNAKFSPSLG
jgi:hypothetical protein